MGARWMIAFLALGGAGVLGCGVPPAFWCDNPQITKVCGASEACGAYAKERSGKPVQLTLLYEGLCPGCRNFITTVLYPIIYRQLKPIVEIELVAYGNARMANGSIVCQHGADECLLNTMHNCGQYYLKATSQGVDWVHCMEAAYPKAPQQAAASCFTALNVSPTVQDKIKLILSAMRRTNGIQPDQHQFVPWILANNVSLQSLQSFQAADALVASICHWYQGSDLPDACQNAFARIRSPTPSLVYP